MPLPDEVASLSAPMLLITSNAPDDVAAADLLEAHGAAGFKRWDPVETGHTQALARHPAEWEQRVVAFLAAALGD